MFTTIGTCPGWVGTTDSHLKRIGERGVAQAIFFCLAY